METPKKLAVLVVDDERVIAWDLREMINAMGYDCFAIASSAEEALHAAETKAPDVVLMDIRLNGPVDGIETARMLQAKYGVRIVFLSAHSKADTAARAEGVDAAAWLTKPIRASVLQKTLQEVLGKPDAG
jgi:CheY-like chemotaxis protein